MAPICQLVQAIYDYQGANNDELCVTKGDIITVTQTPEGGWFEGTLNGVTGWFPSNYVVPIDPHSEGQLRANGVDAGVNSNGLAPSSHHNHESRRKVCVKRDVDLTKTNDLIFLTGH